MPHAISDGVSFDSNQNPITKISGGDPYSMIQTRASESFIKTHAHAARNEVGESDQSDCR
jgi:hypothetical protein